MIVVLKLGGRVAAEAARQVAVLRSEGDQVVVVHGAGPQITAELERRGIPASFVGGRRVTTAEALEVVRASLAAVNAEVCAAIGTEAVCLWGDAIGLRLVLATLDGLQRETGSDRYRAAALLRRMVAEGLNGRSTGRGFHSYQ